MLEFFALWGIVSLNCSVNFNFLGVVIFIHLGG